MKKYSKPELIQISDNTFTLYCQSNGSAAVQAGCITGTSNNDNPCNAGPAAGRSCANGEVASTSLTEAACSGNGQTAMNTSIFGNSCVVEGNTKAIDFCNTGNSAASP